MKNKELAELNFKRLLHYPDEPNVRASDTSPTNCTGYCISCEKNGFLDGEDKRLDQMSHGADTEDFEKMICPLPDGGVEFFVAFLLESPGGYYCNGKPIPYEGITKQPPVNRYYWLPQLPAWPTDADHVGPKGYGPYFAYLISKFRLKNSYFTNVVKCSLSERDIDQFVPFLVAKGEWHRDTKIRTHCFNLFLAEEMRILNPRVVFCFGQRTRKMVDYSALRFRLQDARFAELHHPSARMSRQQLIRDNDEIIRRELNAVY